MEVPFKSAQKLVTVGIKYSTKVKHAKNNAKVCCACINQVMCVNIGNKMRSSKSLQISSLHATLNAMHKLIALTSNENSAL